MTGKAPKAWVRARRGALRAPLHLRDLISRNRSHAQYFDCNGPGSDGNDLNPLLDLMPLLPGGRRRSIRLSNHDYAASATYFLTLCTYRRNPLFGSIDGGVVTLTAVGNIVEELWIQTAEMRQGVVLDAFVIMPDHMHAIVAMPASEWRESSVGSLRRAPKSLGALVAGYKASCTSEVRRLLGVHQVRLWQRNYYERVIRNGRALDRIRRYIAANPACWQHSHVGFIRDQRKSGG